MSTAESAVASIRKRLVPIRPEGVPFVAILAFVALFFGWFWPPVLWLGLALAAWCAYAFRDPYRVSPVDDGIVLSPVDGRVTSVSLGVAPRGTGLGEQMRRRITIALGPFDTRVVRTPAIGELSEVVELTHGGSAEEDWHERDARVAMVVGAGSGQTCIVQTARFPGPRIVPLVGKGDTLVAGQRIGVIWFGATVDVYLPVATSILIAEGQTMIAGETVMASFGTSGSGSQRRARIY